MTQLTYRHDAFKGFIGVARRDITPPIGIYNRNWGAATSDTATGIHRPLTATALAIKPDTSDSPPLVLLSLDLGWWRTQEGEWFVRSAVVEALTLDSACVILHLTHTHAGPSICREDQDMSGGELVPSYLDRLRDTVVEAARAAVQSIVPATLTWAYGKCNLAKNRDLPDPDSPRVACGFNPAPARPADDTLLVGRVTDESGKIIATLVNYACHPVTLAWQNTLISPDYVGGMREVIEANTGDAPCLFLQGASGELAPMEEYTADVAVADRNGRILGYAALSALEGMLLPNKQLRYSGVVESGAPLAAWALEDIDSSDKLSAGIVSIELPLKPTLPKLAEVEAQLASSTDPVLTERLRRRRRLLRIVGDGPTATMNVWVWQIGDAFLVANPHEAYSHLQIELRRRFPNRAMAVLNISNGGYAYLPPQEMYGLDQYQVWQTPYDRGCLETTIDACTRAVEGLLAAR